MIQVKVCGVTRVEDALAAIDAGADAIGLNFIAGTPRALDDERGREISAVCAGRVVRVGVFRELQHRVGSSVGLEPPVHVVVLDELGGILPDSLAPLDQRPCGSVRRSGPLPPHAHLVSDRGPQRLGNELHRRVLHRQQIRGRQRETRPLQVHTARPIDEPHREP